MVPEVELGLELEEPTTDGAALVLTADVVDDGRFPQGAHITDAVLLVGTAEHGDVGRVLLEVPGLPVSGAVTLVSLDFDADVLSLAGDGDWIALRVELAYETGGMSITSLFLQRASTGFEERSRQEFETAVADHHDTGP